MSSTNFEGLKSKITSPEQTKETLANMDVNAKKQVLIETDQNGFTLLHFAVNKGANKVVELILQEASANDVLTEVLTAQDKVGGRTAFHLALGSKKGASSVEPLTISMFKDLKLLKQVLAVKNAYKQELLNKIVADEKLDVLKLMTEQAKAVGLQNEFLNFKAANGKTVLMVASSNGKADFVNYIVTEIAATDLQAQQDNLLAQDKSTNSALHWAAYANSPEIATTLMTAAANAKVLKNALLSQDEDGNTPLGSASYDANKAAVTNTILDKVLENPDLMFEVITLSNVNGESFLSKAVIEGNIDLLKKIITKAAGTEGLVQQIVTFKTDADGPDLLKIATEAVQKATADNAENLTNLQAVQNLIQEEVDRPAKEAEARKAEEARLAKEAEEKKAEEARLAKEAEEKKAEEARLAKEAEEKKAEEARLAKEAEEKKAEEARLAKEAEEKKAEEARLAKEAEEKKAEEARLAKEAEEKKAEEARLAKEAEEKKAEEARLAKEAEEKKAEEARLAKEAEEKKAEEARLAKEAEEKKAEEARLAKEAEEKKAEEARLAKEAEEKKAKPLSSPDLKKFAKSLFDAHHHKQIDSELTILQNKIKTEKNPADIKTSVDTFQNIINLVSGLGGDKEKDVCLDKDIDVHELGGYCIRTLSQKHDNYYKINYVQIWLNKFTNENGSKPIADAKLEFAAAVAIATEKAGCKENSLNSCMNDIVQTQFKTQFCPKSDAYQFEAQKVLCDANFTVESLIV